MAEPMEVPVKLIADVNEAVAFLTAGGKPELAKAVLQMRDLLDAHHGALEASATQGTKAREALVDINGIRNSIIGLQTINWSEHIYPLVAALDRAGLEGMSYSEARGMFGTMLERTLAAEGRAKDYQEALVAIADGEGDHEVIASETLARVAAGSQEASNG